MCIGLIQLVNKKVIKPIHRLVSNSIYNNQQVLFYYSCFYLMNTKKTLLVIHGQFFLDVSLLNFIYLFIFYFFHQLFVFHILSASDLFFNFFNFYIISPLNEQFLSFFLALVFIGSNKIFLGNKIIRSVFFVTSSISFSVSLSLLDYFYIMLLLDFLLRNICYILLT